MSRTYPYSIFSSARPDLHQYCDVSCTRKFGLVLGDGLSGKAIGICLLLLTLEFFSHSPRNTFRPAHVRRFALHILDVQFPCLVQIQRRNSTPKQFICRKLGDPRIRKFCLGTSLRTTMAVFVALLVFHGVSGNPSPIAAKKYCVLSSRMKLSCGKSGGRGLTTSCSLRKCC